MKGKVAEGHTEGGAFVEVWRGEGAPYGEYEVRINGEAVGVAYVRRLRDGGTTILTLEDDREIVFPSRLGDANRTPTLNGQRIEAAG